MNKKRKGFTLPEILIAVVLAGFIATTATQVIQINKTAYVSLAYYTYDNLKGALGELIIPETQNLDIETEGFGRYTMLVTGPTGFLERVIKNDLHKHENYIDLNPEEINFCTSMSEIMNTQGVVDCTTTNNFTLQDAESNDIKVPATPNFTTTNGQRFYFGQDISNATVDFDENVGRIVISDYGYRIVAVDINGKSKPNSSSTVASLPPDIISFAILDNGEVLPLGVAADNIRVGKKTHRYLSSIVNGYRFKNLSKVNVPHFCIAKQPKINEKGEAVPDYICDYAKEGVGNKNDDEKIAFSFRQAYCNALPTDSNFTGLALSGYCNGVIKNTRCPSTNDSNAYDHCKQEIIKPMFRFNFN